MSSENSSIKSPEHFEQVFKEWYKPLCKSAFRIIQDRAATEDVVQGVFVKLWEQRDSLSVNFSLKAYLYRSVMNSSFNYLERNKRLYRPEMENWEIIRGGDSDTEEILHFQDTEKEVNSAINSLPMACRNIFCLSRYDGMSNKEIAEALDISVKTVENQMTKALKILRGKLGPLLKTLIPVILIFLSLIIR